MLSNVYTGPASLVRTDAPRSAGLDPRSPLVAGQLALSNAAKAEISSAVDAAAQLAEAAATPTAVGKAFSDLSVNHWRPLREALSSIVDLSVPQTLAWIEGADAKLKRESFVLGETVRALIDGTDDPDRAASLVNEVMRRSQGTVEKICAAAGGGTPVPEYLMRAEIAKLANKPRGFTHHEIRDVAPEWVGEKLSVVASQMLKKFGTVAHAANGVAVIRAEDMGYQIRVPLQATNDAIEAKIEAAKATAETGRQGPGPQRRGLRGAAAIAEILSHRADATSGELLVSTLDRIRDATDAELKPACARAARSGDPALFSQLARLAAYPSGSLMSTRAMVHAASRHDNAESAALLALLTWFTGVVENHAANDLEPPRTPRTDAHPKKFSGVAGFWQLEKIGYETIPRAVLAPWAREGYDHAVRVSQFRAEAYEALKAHAKAGDHQLTLDFVESNPQAFIEHRSGPPLQGPQTFEGTLAMARAMGQTIEQRPGTAVTASWLKTHLDANHVILINDGSGDATALSPDRYGDDYPLVRLRDLGKIKHVAPDQLISALSPLDGRSFVALSPAGVTEPVLPVGEWSPSRVEKMKLDAPPLLNFSGRCVPYHLVAAARAYGLWSELPDGQLALRLAKEGMTGAQGTQLSGTLAMAKTLGVETDVKETADLAWLSSQLARGNLVMIAGKPAAAGGSMAAQANHAVLCHGLSEGKYRILDLEGLVPRELTAAQLTAFLESHGSGTPRMTALLRPDAAVSQ